MFLKIQKEPRMALFINKQVKYVEGCFVFIKTVTTKGLNLKTPWRNGNLFGTRL